MLQFIQANIIGESLHSDPSLISPSSFPRNFPAFVCPLLQSNLKHLNREGPFKSSVRLYHSFAEHHQKTKVLHAGPQDAVGADLLIWTHVLHTHYACLLWRTRLTSLPWAPLWLLLCWKMFPSHIHMGYSFLLFQFLLNPSLLMRQLLTQVI